MHELPRHRRGGRASRAPRSPKTTNNDAVVGLMTKVPWGRGRSVLAYPDALGCDSTLNLHCARTVHASWKPGGILARLDKGHRKQDITRKWRCYSMLVLSSDARVYVGGKQYAGGALRHTELERLLQACTNRTLAPLQWKPVLPPAGCRGCLNALCERYCGPQLLAVGSALKRGRWQCIPAHALDIEAMASTASTAAAPSTELALPFLIDLPGLPLEAAQQVRQLHIMVYATATSV